MVLHFVVVVVGFVSYGNNTILRYLNSHVQNGMSCVIVIILLLLHRWRWDTTYQVLRSGTRRQIAIKYTFHFHFFFRLKYSKFRQSEQCQCSYMLMPISLTHQSNVQIPRELINLKINLTEKIRLQNKPTKDSKTFKMKCVFSYDVTQMYATIEYLNLLPN